MFGHGFKVKDISLVSVMPSIRIHGISFICMCFGSGAKTGGG
jgi:hypothetical protein